jgi:LysM repeat protein
MTGTDISGWQPGDPDFTGDHFVITKATEGLAYTNPHYAAQLAKARAEQKRIGHYCYLDPGDPVAQANFFLRSVDWRPGEILALDIEGAVLTAGDPVAAAVRFTDTVIAHGHIPASYMSLSTKQQFNWQPLAARNTTLWLAAYNPTGPGDPAPWPFVGIWQNADTNISGGDSDVFEGDDTAWTAIANAGQATHITPVVPHPSAPKPAPHPSMPAIHTFPAMVESGDTFTSIAAQFHVSLAALEAVNPGINYNLITPGQWVHVPGNAPATASTRVHVVKSGEYLLGIANQYGTTVARLLYLNHDISDPNKILVGEKINY